MFKRMISLTLMVTIVLQAVFSLTLFAGDGPSQPEAAQFEPVDATDMVNLYTGDFTYNLPLLEVPGPEGGWPINLVYHAGVGPNTEATWVGLGWTLNPGSINRFLSGYPDDMYAGQLEAEYTIDKVSGWGVGLGISYGPFGISMSMASNKSGLGWNATMNIMGAAAFIADVPAGSGIGSFSKFGKLGRHIGFDFQLSAGSSGVGLSTNIGIGAASSTGIGASLGISAGISSSQKPSAGVGGGAFFSDGKGANESARHLSNSMSLMGVGWSSQGGGASFSVAGTGFHSQSGMEGSGHYSSSSASISIPIGMIMPIPGLGLSVSYFEWEWYLHELHYETAFGMLHQLSYLDNDGKYDLNYVWGDFFETNYLNAFPYMNRLEKKISASPGDAIEAAFQKMAASGSTTSSNTNPDVFYDTKFERNMINGVLFSSEDNYIVNAQGIAGSFRPYFDYAYRLIDGAKSNETGRFGKWGNSENTGAHITFRFDGDQGGNFVSRTSDENYWQDLYAVRQDNQYGGKKIIPVIEPGTGKLSGFQIIAEDGKIYEFFKPVYNYFYNSKSVSATEVANIDTKYKNRQTIKSPYATSWLLTGVKSPDYVDRNEDDSKTEPDGFSSKDFGFWVKFSYENEPVLLPYRSPWEKDTYAPIPGKKDGRTFSEGLRSIVYLDTIQTATHLAVFKKAGRHDDLPSKVNEISMRTRKLYRNNGKIISIFPFSFDSFINMHPDFNLTIAAVVKDKEDWYTEPYLDYQTWNSSEIIVEKNDNGLLKFEVDNKFTESQEDGYYICLTYAKLNFKLEGQNNYQKKLDSIIVYKKSPTEPNGYIDQIIDGVAFNSNYLLMPESNNSDSNGDNTPGEFYDRKLTLEGIQKLGLNGTKYLPETRFTYWYPTTSWKRYGYDNWNGYTSVGSVDNHFNSQDKETADRDAATWSLKSIETPLGAKIIINYESDEINYVKNYPIGSITGRDYENDLLPINTPQPATDAVSVPKGVAMAMEQIVGPNAPRCYILKRTYYSPNSEPYDELLDVYATKVGGENENIVYLNKTCSLPDYEFYDNTKYTTYKYYFFPCKDKNEKLFGGGHRVKSIQVTDNLTTKKTRYIYGDGVTPSLPADYKEKLNFDYRWEQAVLLRGGFNSLGPSPAVGYEKVEVMEVDPHTDKPLNGKMVHTFYTAKDSDWQFNYSRNGDKLKIVDNSGIYGRLKSITTYGLHPESEDAFFPVQQTEFIYKNSSQLAETFGIGIVDHGENLNTKPLLGLTQQKTYSKIGDKNPTYVERLRENVFMTQIRTRTWFYDENYNETGTQEKVMDNLVYDAITGKVLASVNRDEKENQIISEQVPAYWYYGSLEAKNMLTQLAATNGYLVPPEISIPAFLNLTTSEKKAYIKSSSATTWKDWGNFVWRQNDTYNYYKPLSEFSSPFYSTSLGQKYFTFLSAEGNVSHSISLGSGNQSVGNLKLCIRFGHDSESNKGDARSCPDDYRYSYDKLKVITHFTDNSSLSKTLPSILPVTKLGPEFYIPSDQQKTVQSIEFIMTNPKVQVKPGGTDTWIDYTGTSKFMVDITEYGSLLENHTNDDFYAGWKRTSNITAYDRYGHPIEERGLDGTYTASIYGYNDALPIAIAKNARKGEIFFNSFDNLSDWDNHLTGCDHSFYHTGNSSGKIEKPTSGEYYSLSNKWLQIDLTSTKKFIYSGWVYSDGPSADIFLLMKRDGEAGYFTYVDHVTTNETNKWVYLEKELDVPADVTQINIRVDNNGGGTVWFDDIRIHPADATMSTFTYDPITWKVKTITDANNITTYYEYDEAGRLKAVRDQDGFLVKQYKYNYQRNNH